LCHIRSGLFSLIYRGLSVCMCACVSAGYNHRLTKMAKPIELPFGVWTQMSPGVELDLSKGRGIVGGDIPVHVQT